MIFILKMLLKFNDIINWNWILVWVVNFYSIIIQYAQYITCKNPTTIWNGKIFSKSLLLELGIEN